MYLHEPVLRPSTWYRVDTASGSNTPTTVYAHDTGADPIGTVVGASGSTVRAVTARDLGHFWSGTQTLYCKELDWLGAPTGTVVTSTGQDLTPVLAPDLTTIINGLLAGAASIASVTTLSSQVPTLEELSQGAAVGLINATKTVLLPAAQFDQRVGAFMLTASAAVAASDTDYWTVDLVRYRAGAAVTIATKTTKTTGGAAVTASTAWTFDLVTWSATRRLLQRQDVLALVFTKTGAPADLTDVSVGWRYEPGVNAVTTTTIATDDFNRADSTTTMGTTPVGAKAWTNLHAAGSAWGILSNQAYLATPDGTNRCINVVDAGVADCTVSVKFVNTSNSGIAVRMTTDTNGFISNASQFFRWQAGALTAICTFSSSIANGDVLGVEMAGSGFTFYKNGAVIGTAVDTFNQTATKHGLKTNTDSTGKFDDFSVVVTS